jgi:hypothetical protein
VENYYQEASVPASGKTERNEGKPSKSNTAEKSCRVEERNVPPQNEKSIRNKQTE